MRDTITTTIKHIAKDRAMLAIFATLIVGCLVAAVYFAIRIKVSEIQVVTRYNSYGGVNFYTDQWFYAISYVAFFVMVAIAHTAIGAKLYVLKGRRFALYFGWFSLGMVVLGVANFLRIVNVAFPL